MLADLPTLKVSRRLDLGKEPFGAHHGGQLGPPDPPVGGRGGALVLAMLGFLTVIPLNLVTVIGSGVQVSSTNGSCSI